MNEKVSKMNRKKKFTMKAGKKWKSAMNIIFSFISIKKSFKLFCT